MTDDYQIETLQQLLDRLSKKPKPPAPVPEPDPPRKEPPKK